LRQQYLCRLEADATFSLTTAEKKRREKKFFPAGQAINAS